MLIRTTSKTWYQSDFQFELPVLQAYIAGAERLVRQQVEEYGILKSSDLFDSAKSSFEEDPPVRLHMGLDDLSYDFDEVFIEYLPFIYRANTLITVYSFLEIQLDQLCSLIQRERGYSLRPIDLRGKGIDRSLSYLSKVCGLAVDRDKGPFKEVDLGKLIRNYAVHADSVAPRDRPELLKYLNESGFFVLPKSLSEETPHYSGGDRIRIGPDYLAHLLEVIDEGISSLGEQLK